MPSTTERQHNFMNAIAHSKEFAKKAGVPQSVGKDFSEADKESGKFKGKKDASPKETMHKLYGKE